MLGLSSCEVCSILRYVYITVRHVFTGTCTCPCFREYFSLEECAGVMRYNIFGYSRVYFTLGGCMDVRMSNVICGGISTPLSLELAQMVLMGGSLQYDGFL